MNTTTATANVLNDYTDVAPPASHDLVGTGKQQPTEHELEQYVHARIDHLVEVDAAVPAHLVAHFDTTIVARPADTDGDGNVDSILLGQHAVSAADWAAGQFNMLGQTIKRDDTHQVTTNNQLIAAFNDHPFAGSKLGLVTGYGLTIASLGSYTLARRRVVPPGYFGHYISTQRHKLIKAGVHTLIPVTSTWCDDVLIDDEANPNRKFGDKNVLQVPENHLAGGYRIGAEGDMAQVDQEFVLFSQGRHVLPESKYYGVSIVKLDSEKLTLGPLTVLYVKEGWLGGCNHRKTGVYQILYPGPPYVLHEQDYEAIELVQRTDDIFQLGPYEFVTVKAGQVAGAYLKRDGTFQILRPGASYQLHSREYQPAEVMTRKTKFSLGPYYYLQAKAGFESGVHMKKTGTFQRLAPGKTYRLDKETFTEPVTERRDTHVTNIGPLTLLTVAQGRLNGAYRVTDGVFVEFDDASMEYVLHRKVYHGLVSIPKFSAKAQAFGPFTVITIRDGYVGLAEQQGKIVVLQPGHYKLDSTFKLYEPIPTKMFQDTDTIEFRTKDGIAMEVKTSMTWNVTDPEAVARFAGTFDDLRALLCERARDSITRLCKSQNRGQLLPTRQDLPDSGSTAEAEAEIDRRNRALLETLAASSFEDLKIITETCKLGATVAKVQIDRFEVKDFKIIASLTEITKSELAAKAECVRARFEVARATADKETRETEAEADAAVSLHHARAAAEVRRCEFESRIAEQEAENSIRAAAEATLVKIEAERTVQSAQAEAEAIRAVTQAEFDKAMKEREAAGTMSAAELEIKKLELQVQSLAAVGNAAWKYPDVYSAFLETFGTSLRYGPLTAAESLSRANLIHDPSPMRSTTIAKTAAGAPELDDASFSQLLNRGIKRSSLA